MRSPVSRFSEQEDRDDALERLASDVQRLALQEPSADVAAAAWRLLNHSTRLQAGRWHSVTLLHLRAKLRTIARRAEASRLRVL